MKVEDYTEHAQDGYENRTKGLQIASLRNIAQIH